MSKQQVTNFFDPKYITEKCSDLEFGLCDGDNEKKEPAYISRELTLKDTWVASIVNLSTKEVTFLPVDNNIPMYKSDGDDEKRCDGILLYKENLQESICFVELKERTDKQNRMWRRDGVEQLKATIAVFNSLHSIEDYEPRRAIVCNSKRSNYTYTAFQELDDFRKQYKVSLSICPIIEV